MNNNPFDHIIIDDFLEDDLANKLSSEFMDYNDPKLSLGYIKIGQVNLEKSFGTVDFAEILKKLSAHLDIYQIHADSVTGTFDYVWSDDNYKQMQIDFLQPGYDWSKKNA